MGRQYYKASDFSNFEDKSIFSYGSDVQFYSELGVYRKTLPGFEDSEKTIKRGLAEVLASKLAYRINEALGSPISVPDVNIELDGSETVMTHVVSQSVGKMRELESTTEKKEAAEKPGVGVITALAFLLQNPDANQDNIGIQIDDQRKLALIDQGLSFFPYLLQHDLLHGKNEIERIMDEDFSSPVTNPNDCETLYQSTPENLLIGSCLPQKIPDGDKGLDSSYVALNTFTKGPLPEHLLDHLKEHQATLFNEMLNVYKAFVELYQSDDLDALKEQTYNGYNDIIHTALDELVGYIKQRASQVEQTLNQHEPEFNLSHFHIDHIDQAYADLESILQAVWQNELCNLNTPNKLPDVDCSEQRNRGHQPSRCSDPFSSQASPTSTRRPSCAASPYLFHAELDRQVSEEVSNCADLDEQGKAEALDSGEQLTISFR